LWVYYNQLSRIDDGPTKDGGVAFGYSVAQAIMQLAPATLLERFLGTYTYSFQLTTMGMPEPRTFQSHRAAAEEAGRSRIYGGIHFQFANEDGLKTGTALGHYVYDSLCQPL